RAALTLVVEAPARHGIVRPDPAGVPDPRAHRPVGRHARIGDRPRVRLGGARVAGWIGRANREGVGALGESGVAPSRGLASGEVARVELALEARTWLRGAVIERGGR